MSEPNQSLEESLFEAALAKASPEDRTAFLDGVCRGNPALRARLEALLEGHFQAAGFLAAAPKAAQIGPAPPPQAEAASACVGRYKLLEKIGEGGFGEVWMAEQREPVNRRVALKIIKLISVGWPTNRLPAPTGAGPRRERGNRSNQTARSRGAGRPGR